MDVALNTVDFTLHYRHEEASGIYLFFCNVYGKLPYRHLKDDLFATYNLTKDEAKLLIDFITTDPCNMFNKSADRKASIIYDLNQMLLLLRKNEKIKVNFAD